jgi:SAM-dependent methyltransferase
VSTGLEHTLAFILAHTRAPSRVLEVGAGDGRLSIALAGRGHAVTLLDRTFEMLAREARDDARIEKIERDFLAYEDARPFDAILFTRSLHHLHDLDAALDRARELLWPNGQVIVEDFDLAAPDEATARWFYGERGGLDFWRKEHEELHAGATMRAALAARFSIVHEERVAYLYRAMAGAPRTDEEIEIAAGRISPVGLRIVAQRRPPPAKTSSIL